MSNNLEPSDGSDLEFAILESDSEREQNFPVALMYLKAGLGGGLAAQFLPE